MLVTVRIFTPFFYCHFYDTCFESIILRSLMFLRIRSIFLTIELNTITDIGISVVFNLYTYWCDRNSVIEFVCTRKIRISYQFRQSHNEGSTKRKSVSDITNEYEKSHENLSAKSFSTPLSSEALLVGSKTGFGKHPPQNSSLSLSISLYSSQSLSVPLVHSIRLGIPFLFLNQIFSF